MPKLNLPIPDVDNTITRNVVYGVIDELAKLMYLPNELRILMPGIMEQTYHNKSNIGEQEDYARFTNLPTIIAEVSETLVEDEIGRNDLMTAVNANIFNDPELILYLLPNYSFMQVEITFRLSHTSRSLARQWRDEIRNKVRQGRQMFVHTANYHYRINPIVWIILKEIHRLRENQHGYGEDYLTYLNNIKNERLIESSNQKGSYSEHVMSETMRRIVGEFDFVISPDDGQEKEDKTTHETSFTYRFNYDKATSFTFTYPLVIHNQLLSSKYRRSESKFSELNRTELLSFSNNALRYFEGGALMHFKLPRINGIHIPLFDEFIPRSIQLKTINVVTGLIQMKQTEPGQKLLNLTELGKYQLKPIIVEYLKSEVPWLTKEYKSFMQLDLYLGDTAIGKHRTPLLVDEDLNIFSNMEIDLRKVYHVRLGLVSDINLVDRDAIDRLRQNACVLDELLQVMYPFIDFTGMINPVGSECGPISKADMDKIIGKINRYEDGMTDQYTQFNVLGLFTVESYNNLIYMMEKYRHPKDEL